MPELASLKIIYLCKRVIPPLPRECTLIRKEICVGWWIKLSIAGKGGFKAVWSMTGHCLQGRGQISFPWPIPNLWGGKTLTICSLCPDSPVENVINGNLNKNAAVEIWQKRATDQHTICNDSKCRRWLWMFWWIWDSQSLTKSDCFEKKEGTSNIQNRRDDRPCAENCQEWYWWFEAHWSW